MGRTKSFIRENLSNLKDQIEQAMKSMPEMNQIQDQVNMTVSGEGLCMELLETESGIFFKRGQPLPSNSGQDVLILLAKELGKMPNRVLIEGHTEDNRSCWSSLPKKTSTN